MSLSCFSSLLATLAKHIFEQPGQYRAWMLPSCPNCCYGAERGLNCDWSTQQDHIFAALWFNLQAAPEPAEPPDQQQVQPEGPLLQLSSSPPPPLRAGPRRWSSPVQRPRDPPLVLIPPVLATQGCSDGIQRSRGQGTAHKSRSLTLFFTLFALY